MQALPHQVRPIQKALEYLRDPKRNKYGVIVSPTAGGKSFILAEVARQYGEPILVLQPNKELLEQNAEKSKILGSTATVCSASLSQRDISTFTYATIGSIKKDVNKLIALGVKTLFIDECHSKFSPEEGSEFQQFLKALNPKKVIGFTATPFRLSPGGMNEGSKLKMLTRTRPKIFSEFIDVVQIKEVTEGGWWSKIKYEAHEFDESGLEVNTSGSEYTDESVKVAIKAQNINNTIYLRAKQLLKEGCPSILIFMDSVENAEIMAKHLPDAIAIHGKTPTKVRDQGVKDFKSGKIKVLVNMGVFTTGFDYPDLRAIIMGRPTMSLSLYYQIIGRGTRISKETGKEHCLYIDYCNNVKRFGKIENLTIENIPGVGWAVCNGDIVLTGYAMDGPIVTREKAMVLAKRGNQKVDKIWFGKYKGTALDELPIYYIEYLLYKTGWDFSSGKMFNLKTKLLQVLKENEENKLLLKTA
jgi:DNA repair protein RadD